MKAKVTIELIEDGAVYERHEITREIDDCNETTHEVVGSAIACAVESICDLPRKILMLAEAMISFDEWMSDEERAFYQAARDVVDFWKKVDEDVPGAVAALAEFSKENP